MMKKINLFLFLLVSSIFIFGQTTETISDTPHYAGSNLVEYNYPYTESDITNRNIDINLIVGKTNTKYTVTQTGAFNYTIPISLPKGTAGVTPSLSLNYSSQSGSGIAGYGWNLAGFSSISRTNKNHFKEEKSENVLFDYSDPFHLDGNRLILASGLQGQSNSTYKTESETFTLITAEDQQGSGPKWFRVELKDGTIMEYGNSISSRCHLSSNFEVLEWKLNKVIDRNGNYIEYIYTDFGGEVVPHQIIYTANISAEMTPYYQVNFEYEDRLDEEKLIGTERLLTINKKKILKVIKVLYGESNIQVKKYELNYGLNFYSYLNDITEYGSDGVHFNPTHFNYWDAGHLFSEVTFTNQSLNTDLYPGDFNGDGITDLLTLEQVPFGTNNTKVIIDIQLGLIGGGYISSTSTINNGSSLIELLNSKKEIVFNNSYFQRSPSLKSIVSAIDIGDYDGDGKDDMVLIRSKYYNTQSMLTQAFPTYIELYKFSFTNNIASIFSSTQLNIPQNAYHNRVENPGKHNYYGNRNPFLFADFDGDGAKDIFLNTHDGFKEDVEHEHNQYYPVIFRPRISNNPIPISGGSNFQFLEFSKFDDDYLLDMNGNGKMDIMQIFSHEEENRVDVFEFEFLTNNASKKIIFTDYRPGQTSKPNPNYSQIIKTGDFNGDGKTDIITTDKNNPDLWVKSLSYGNQFNIEGGGFRFGLGASSQLTVGDVNSDGKADLIGVYDNPNAPVRIKIHYSNGLDFNSYTYDISSINYNNSSNFLIIDSEGKGFLSALVSDEAQRFKFSEVSFNHANKFGQLRYISSGFNEITEVNYLSIANQFQDPLYSNTNTSSYYPNIEYNKPLHVVTSVTSPDGSGKNSGSNTITSRYLYTRARLNLQGRGFLGFEKVESYSSSPTRLDANSNPIVTLNSDEYELENTFIFPRLIKSHQSQVVFTSANPFIERNYKNLYSKEYEYSTIPLDNNKRFINQLDRTIEGDNIVKSKTVTEYNYNSLTSSQNGNVDAVITTTGEDLIGKVVTTTEYKYGNFGTITPAHITEKSTSSIRTFKNITELPASSKTTYHYDLSTGNVLWKKDLDPQNNSLLVQKDYLNYSTTGIPKRIKTNIPGHSSPDRFTNFLYDASDRFVLEKVAEINGSNEYKEVWTYDDATGLLLTYDDILPNNGIATYSYNSMHQKIAETDELGNTTTIVREFDIASNSSSNEFIPDAHLYTVSTSSPNLGSSKVYIDHNGQERMTETTDFSGNISKQVANYNEEGQMLTSTAPFTSIQNIYDVYSYDELGRMGLKETFDKTTSSIISTILIDRTPFNGGFPFSYDNQNFTTTTYRDGLLNSETKADPTGMMVESTDNSSVLVEHLYNSFGSLNETKVQGSTVSSSEYNHLGQQTHLNEINSGITTYSYNQIGELTSQTDANNNTTGDLIYDRFGRMIQKEVIGQGTYSYEYFNFGNGIGQMARIVAPNGTEVTYQYNVNGQVSQQTDIIAGISYTKEFEYDIQGRVNLERYATGTEVGYQYNADGYLEMVYNVETGQAYFNGAAVDDFGNWTSYQMYDGNTTTKTYDELGRPKTVVASGIYEREYEFDLKTSNLNMRKDLLRNNTETFTYDGLDRLVEARLNGNLYLGMQYDDNGNIDNKSDIGDYTYHPTKKNAVVMVDNNQNLIHSTTQDIEYDELHNPKSIVENGNEWHFEYDVNHHRNRAQIISSGGSTTTRVYVGNSEYQYDQNGDLLYSVDYVAGGDGLCALVVRDFTPTATTSEPQVFTVYKDYLGSINVLVDENGTVAAEQEFDPWGRYRDASTWTASTTLPALPNWLWRGYTGHEHIEEFQLINMNGRLYDPYIGRMLSPDNFVQDAVSTQNYNRYSYALNNPMKYTDPDGEWLWAIPAAVGFAVGYISHGASTGNWGSSALLSGAIGAGVAVLGFYSGGASSAAGIAGGFKSAGLSGHAATVALGYSGQYAASASVSTILPSVNVPLGNNISANFGPGVLLGGGQMGLSINGSITYNSGNFSVSAGFSARSFSSSLGSGPEMATFYGGGWDDGTSGFGLSSSSFHSGNSSQKIGGASLSHKIGDERLGFRYENDGAPLHGILGNSLNDGGDRYRTAAARLNYGNINLTMNLFTGDHASATNVEGHSKKYPMGYYSGGDVDNYRLGALTVGYGNYNLGINSERVRHGFQNVLAHTWIKRQPAFKMLDRSVHSYFQYRTNSPNTLW